MNPADLAFAERVMALLIMWLPWLLLFAAGAGIADWLETRRERRRADLNYRPITRWSRR